MSGFTDLRLDRAGSHADESFWPSFTDIMMVVVMIFLITSATLILRNSELIRLVTETEEAKKLAAELAQDSQAENLSLEEQIESLRHQLSMARLQQLKTMEEKFTLEKQLEETNNRLGTQEVAREELGTLLVSERDKSSRLETELEALRQQLRSSEQERGVVAGDLESTLAQLDATNQSLNQLQQQYNLSRDELTRAIAELAESDTRISALQSESSSRLETVQLSEEKLAALRAEYEDLRVKYDILVRPARTTKDKYVVSVRYARIAGESVISLKEPADGDFTPVNETTMHSQLAALKEQYAERLYVRIIIPDDSNLSYNEAWAFTRDLLNRYDYYHQGDYNPVTPIE